MVVKKFYSIIFCFTIISCNSNNEIFYLKNLAKEINNHNYTSNYNFSDFYFSIKGKDCFKKISYAEIYNDFYFKKNSSLTTEKYLLDLFNNGIEDGDLDCIPINNKIQNLYNRDQKGFLDKTSYLESDSTRILKNDNINFLEVENILYFYSKMGYQINNDDYTGVTILYKPNR